MPGVVLCYAVVNLGKQRLYLVNKPGMVTFYCLTPNKRILIGLRLYLRIKAWLKSQSTYQLQKPKKETHEEPPLKLQCPKNGKYYSFQEIQAFYGISRPTLDSWVLKEGIPTMKLGRVKRIQKDAFDEVLKSKRKVEEDV